MFDGSRLRGRVAEEAARLIQEQGIDFRQAKHKAAERLGVSQRGALPSNKEIEQRLLDRQRLFGASQSYRELNRLRQLALELMATVAPFSPRAVGSVVSGALSPTLGIQLHLFAGSVETVCDYLSDRDIHWKTGTRQFMHRPGQRGPVPTLALNVEEVSVELAIFSTDAQRQAPLSPIDGRPMQRLNPKRLAALAAEA